ncbi:hypothetical protein D3C73_659840 [compost metagenome]
MLADIGEIERPIEFQPVRSVFTNQHLAGFQLENVAKGCARRDWGPQGENLVERERIEFGRDTGHGQKCLRFRGEIEGALVLCVKERPHAHAVARQQQFSLRRIPDGESEIAVELLQAGLAVMGVKLQQHFRIRACTERRAARLQLVA